MCQHLYPYSIRGQRKRDYPAFYSEHNPWTTQFRHFNDYFTALGFMLSQSREEADVAVIHSDGSVQPLGVGGYLDVGIHDTMKDLLVNMVGAVVFSIIGYCFVKKKGKGKFAPRFIPRVLTDEEKPEKPE